MKAISARSIARPQSVDEGHISALDREASEPVSEVELELKAGEDRSILYDIALRLLENVPTLRLEMRSKAARGYDLVTRAVRGRSKPRDYTAAPVELDQAMTLDAALSAVGLWGMVQLLRNERGALAGDAESIHQFRVATRRLR